MPFLLYFFTPLFAFFLDTSAPHFFTKKNIISNFRDTLGYEVVSELAASDSSAMQLPGVKNYMERVTINLSQKVNILPLFDTLNADRQAAQQLAIEHSAFQKYLRDVATDAPIRNEIFGVYPARMSDFTAQNVITFRKGGCYRVEMYNYALNLAIVGLVSLPEKKIVGVYYTPYTQPDIPSYLKEIALQIAVNSPLVKKALGYQPDPKNALMPDTKTALNRSRCERSKHLCVAPTFVKGNKALWAIVDLTDLRLVGIRWTNVGTQNAPQKPVTERQIQNETMSDCFCKIETPLQRNDWQLNYMLTSSDGLRVSDVRFKNQTVVRNAKLVDWHVSYSNTDGFGYSDAVGCPYFSTAAVVAIETPKVMDLLENDKKVGFVLIQSFFSEGWPTPCNYNYEQRFEFYDDGRFRVTAASLGRGCGNDGTYRPVFRIAMAANQAHFSEWKNNDWAAWQRENWQQQNVRTAYSPQGYQYRIGNYFVEPGNGQFADKGRGDNALAYVTVAHSDRDEGESDLVTIGPCCNTDYRQGPEKFMEPQAELLADESLVFWYVPTLKNDDTKGKEYCWAEASLRKGVWATKSFPCWAGPMFVPTPK